MGMFDYVNFEMDCPKCGRRLPQWQTKDTDCVMERVDPAHTNFFYEKCDGCHSWIEFRRIQTPRTDPRPVPFTRAEVEEMGFVMHFREW